MQTVLNSPVSLDELFQAPFIRLLGQQAGDTVSDFAALASVGQPGFTFYRKQLSGMGKIHLLGFYRHTDNASAFDAAMSLFQFSFFLANSDSGSIVLAFRKSAAWFSLIVST